VDNVSPARAGTVIEVSLNFTEPELASLGPRAASAPPLVAEFLSGSTSPRWATAAEVSAAREWLGAAAAGVNQRATAASLVERPRGLVAEWRWPDHPLIEVRLDGEPIAVVDYLPASASIHWFLHWTGGTSAAHGSAELPLLPLATRVPEEAEEDVGTRMTVLDTAIEAAANELTGRVIRLELRDV
jgi:hypothetical protein